CMTVGMPAYTAERSSPVVQVQYPMPLHESRRRFLTAFSGLGLGGTLLPGVLWAQVQQSAAQRITPEMLRGALDVAGLTFTDEDQKAMLQSVNQSLTRYEDVRKLAIPNNVAPPFYFSAITPGMKVNRTPEP